ncbi:hypothetical protein L7F22_010286 [Adiantum nelumboides]|nr:hypothetical protein [Adiantum nelumboides]
MSTATHKGASSSTRASNVAENDPISPNILDPNTITSSTMMTKAMIMAYLVTLQETVTKQGKDLCVLVMENGTLRVLLDKNEHLKKVLEMQTTCLMQLENEVQVYQRSFVEMNALKERLSKVENDYALKGENMDTMRCDVSEMKDVTKLWADVCNGNVVFDSPIIQAMAHTKNAENVDAQDMREWKRRSKNIVIRGIVEEKMPRHKTARQWNKAPYEVDELSTNKKSHIPYEVLAQIPAHIFITKFRDEEGDNIKTTIMPREIWTLHRRPEVASPVKAVHLEQFFRLPPWGTDYMRAHELMSSIQYDRKAMLIDSDGTKVEVLITKEIINEALQFLPRPYDLIPKTKAIDNEKAFLKVKGSKFKYIEPFLHMAVVMALCVAERRQVRCDYAKFILESLIEANLKNSARNKLYMSAGSMLTRVAYQALGMIEDLPAASSQAALNQQAKYVPKAVKTTSSAASSRSTRSKKSSNDDERTDTDKEQDSQKSAWEDVPKEVEATSPSEYKRSDEEDTSTPLEKRSQKPRSREQVPMDEAMARVQARRKELVEARTAKAAKTARLTTMEEARKLRIEKAKALQKERNRIEVEEKAQEEAEAAQATQIQEKEVIDLSGTVEYLKTIEREKHMVEQWAAQLAREKIKEALSRKAEEPVLEPSQGSLKRPRQEEEDEIEHIQADPIPSSPMNIPPAPPSSPITPFPSVSTPRTPPSPSPLDLPKSPPAPTSPQQQQFSAERVEIQTSLQEETEQPMDRTEEEEKQIDSEQQKPAEIDLSIPIMQFKCQQVVAKETDVQKDKANKAYEEITNLGTALELDTLERDTNAKENENLLRNLLDL